jgi:HAE1 family hydrophobic/amphiphilic exporter-1
VDGVARAGAWGLLKRSVRIFLDQEEVSRRRIDLRDLLRRLRGDNLTTDLGDLREGDRKSYLRASMEFDSIEELREFPVLQGLKLKDIARVEVVPALDEGLSRYNGNSVIVGTIHKVAGANTVDVCRRLREQFEVLKAQPDAAPELELIPFWDMGAEIESSLETLYKNALYGGVLAVLILYGFFRRLRMTLLVAAAIPLSLTIAVTVLYLGGSSLNLATMMGLTIAVGMLIDNAIVVVEAILRRRETGDQPDIAAAEGAGEVGLAVVTATLTTIVVFLPAMLLSGGDTQLWLMSIGGPIAFALLASLAVALVLVPLGSIYLRKDRHSVRTKPGGGSPQRSHGYYERFLRAFLANRFAVMVLGLLIFLSGGIAWSNVSRKGAMGRGGGPIRISLRFPRHYDLRMADEVVRQYEEHVETIKERLGLEGIYARFDRRGGMAMLWQADESNTDRMELQEEIRKGWPQIAGVWNSLEGFGGESGSTRITLEGEDANALEQTMDLIEKRLESLPSVAETKREREAGLQELRVEIDPEAVERGEVRPELVRGVVGWVLRGARLRDYRSEGRDLPVLVELDPDQSVGVGDLGAVMIPTDKGFKPLSTLTTQSIRSAPSGIERRDGRRVAEMEVVGKSEDDRGFHGEVQSVIESVDLPPGVRFKVGGSWADLQQNFGDLGKALLLGAIFVFLLTGVLFESLVLPFAVVFSIFPALAGAIWALYLSGKPLDELAMLGGILLVGVVVNNGIVLIDRAQQRRRAGMPLYPAVIAAGRDRFRPVVMTAGTTIAGLLPMAMFKDAKAEIHYDTLATAVIGGLFVSTLVTLALIPVVYTILVDFGRLASMLTRRLLSLAFAR